MFTLKNILILILRNALVSFVVILITIIGIFFLSKEISKMSNAVTSENNAKAELQRGTGIIEVFNNDTKIVGTNYSKIENFFIPADDILEFINTLDSLTNQNIAKQIYSFNTPVPSNISAPFPISTISYSNNFTGNISSFITYLKEFEKLQYFTSIQGFSISSQDKMGWSGASTILFHSTLYAKTVE